MSLNGQKITGVKVIDIMEESAETTEKMVNRAIQDINNSKIKILDIQTTGDHVFLIFGE